jgi:hypothetical protein
MVYSIVDFAKSLRTDRCKIRNPPNLIFLCGGKTADAGSLRSARDYFYRHLKRKTVKIAQRVKLAEDVNACFRGGEFPDLLELENYLADLADIILLFVESAGSIAELGAFAASEVLRPKTLAVLNEYYGSDPSFISEGPVKTIKNANDQLVHYFDWDPKHLNTAATQKVLREMAEILTAFLVARDKANPQLEKFDKANRGHKLLVVADLIGIAGVATTTDISNCLAELDCKVDQVELGRYLSLLANMSFIKQVRRSNQAFYVSNSLKSFIRFGYHPAAVLRDLKRIKSVIRAALEPMRRNILSKVLLKSRTVTH